MQVTYSSPVCEEQESCRGSDVVLQDSRRTTIYLFKQFFGKTYRLATMHAWQTTANRRQTVGQN